ncbi:hypothetical protein Ahia01_000781300 [Argonauta hians]
MTLSDPRFLAALLEDASLLESKPKNHITTTNSPSSKYYLRSNKRLALGKVSSCRNLAKLNYRIWPGKPVPVKLSSLHDDDDDEVSVSDPTELPTEDYRPPVTSTTPSTGTPSKAATDLIPSLYSQTD